MPSFGRCQFELRIGAQCPAEFVATSALALRRAVDEREVLVRVGGVGVAQPELEGGLQAAGGVFIVATIVLAQPKPESAATLGEPEKFAQLIAQIAHRLRAAPRLCPSTRTSPQGATASSTRALPPPTAAVCLSRRASFLPSGASAFGSARMAAAAGAGPTAARL